jgi:hypothetical protein
MQGVQDALGNISRLGSSADTGAGFQACGRLGRAVTKAEAAPPMPEHGAEVWYLRALAEYGQAAADCQAGISARSTPVISEATAASRRANADLGRATAAIRRLLGD